MQLIAGPFTDFIYLYLKPINDKKENIHGLRTKRNTCSTCSEMMNIVLFVIYMKYFNQCSP